MTLQSTESNRRPAAAKNARQQLEKRERERAREGKAASANNSLYLLVSPQLAGSVLSRMF